MEIARAIAINHTTAEPLTFLFGQEQHHSSHLTTRNAGQKKVDYFKF
jgi:hypothetical protein